MAAAMVVLPLVYLGLIGLAVWGTASWALNGLSLIATWAELSARPRGLTILLLYIGPLAAGATVVVFLVKPLFAPRRKAVEPLRLKPHEQPLLFAFVQRLCEAVGSPPPREIRVDCRVNASAGLRRGVLSLGRSDLVLTIGLPLAAGMTVEQLAGVLAHEFGHFAQRSAMAMSYVIRTVNHWFERVVYERDAWDAQLIELSRTGDLRIRLVAGLARGCVWLSRRVLWALMVAGHALSCLLMRHMEFDADRYEARLVGSRIFTATMGEIFALAAGDQQAGAELSEAWREGRLADSLPALIVAGRRALAEPIANAFKEHLAKARTGRFDTHPADPQRIANAHREGPDGLFACPLPAASLLSDLPALERAATLQYYQAVLGDQADAASLVASGELVAHGETLDRERQAAERVFHGLVSPLRPLPLTVSAARPGEARTAPVELARELAETSAAAAESAAGLRELWPRLLSRRDELNRALQAEALLAAGRPVDPALFRLTEGVTGSASEVRQAAESWLDAQAPAVDRFNELIARRVTVSLALLAAARGGDAGDAPPAGAAEDADLLTATAEVGGLAETVRALRRSLVVLDGLWSQVEGETKEPKLVRAIREESARALGALETIHGGLREVSYPFAHARDRLDLASYVVPDVPPATELYPIYVTGHETLRRLFAVYERILGVLATRVEEAEALHPGRGDLARRPAADPDAARAG